LFACLFVNFEKLVILSFKYSISSRHVKLLSGTGISLNYKIKMCYSENELVLQNISIYHVFLVWMGKTTPRALSNHRHRLDARSLRINYLTINYFFIVQPKRSDISLYNIVTSRPWAIVFTKIKSSDVFSLISDIKTKVSLQHGIICLEFA